MTDNGDYGLSINNGLVARCSILNNPLGAIDNPGGLTTMIDNHAP